MMEPKYYLDLSKIFESLADYQLKRETSGRRWMLMTQRSLNTINELCNLAMEHRHELMACGFLEPMQVIVSTLIESLCQAIEAQGSEADHLVASMKEIHKLVDKAVKEYERREREKR